MQRDIKVITENKNLRGVRVLLRASINVPIKEGGVLNDFRITQALPTINYLREQGAKVIIIGHIGREGHETLLPVFKTFKQFIPLTWCGEASGNEVREAVDKLADGEVLLLENLRRHPGEVENNEDFARELAALADIYVNDAFSVSHRKHTSIVGVPRFIPGYAGITFLKEITELSKAFTPEHPALFILGGIKFETKKPLIAKFLKTYDKVFVGGVIANDFLKAKGFEVGQSHVSDTAVSKDILEHPRISLPTRVVIENEKGKKTTKSAEKVHKEDTIFDVIFPEKLMEGVKTILWNGPMGYYEEGFDEGTIAMALLLAKSDAYTIVGGGDTVAAIERLGLNSKFNFVSTGGGAMLAFLEAGTLPGIEILSKNAIA